VHARECSVVVRFVSPPNSSRPRKLSGPGSADGEGGCHLDGTLFLGMDSQRSGS
jgi:hypothetical protein